MRTMVQLITVSLLALGALSLARAQWVTTQPQFPGATNALIALDTNVYAGTDGIGVRYSANRGVNWQATAADIANGYVRALAAVYNGFSDTSLFIGTPTGMFRYDPWSYTLQDVSTDLQNTDVRAMLAIGESLYVGTGGGVFFSASRGAGWALLNNGMPDSVVSAFAWKDDGAGNTVLLAGTPNGVYGSTNGGQDWSSASTGLTSPSVQTLLITDGAAFAGTTGGVFRATSDSLHWTAAIGGLTNLHVRDLAMDSVYLIAATAGGAFRSVDQGTSWSAINSGLTSNDVRALTVHRGRLFAATGNGVYYSTNHGGTWTRFLSGLDNGSFGGLATMPKPGGGTYLFAGLNPGGVFRSSDNGTTWQTCNVGLRNIGVQALGVFTKPGNIKELWVGTYKGMFRSTDHGDTWVSAGQTLDTRQVRTALYTGSVMIAGTTAGPYRSTDDGAQWTLSNTGISANYVIDLLEYGSTVLAGTTAAVSISTDGGVSWTPSGSGITVGNIFRLISVPNGVSGNDIYAGSGGAGVYKSTNGGASWTQAANGLTNPNALALASSGTTVFAGLYFTGVFYSTNGGANWAAANTGIPDMNIRALHVDGGTIYAGTDRGLAYRPIAQIVTDVPGSSTTLPREVALYQNFPNPFNPTTEIRYDVPAFMHVTLTVHDVLGRTVAELVRGRVTGGQHTAHWDASMVASGVYFLRLHAGERSILKHMLVVK